MNHIYDYVSLRPFLIFECFCGVRHLQCHDRFFPTYEVRSFRLSYTICSVTILDAGEQKMKILSVLSVLCKKTSVEQSHEWKTNKPTNLIHFHYILGCLSLVWNPSTIRKRGALLRVVWTKTNRSTADNGIWNLLDFQQYFHNVTLSSQNCLVDCAGIASTYRLGSVVAGYSASYTRDNYDFHVNTVSLFFAVFSRANRTFS